MTRGEKARFTLDAEIIERGNQMVEKFEHIHPSLVEALKLDAENWHTGGGNIEVTTHSGSVYNVTSEGVVSGGRHGITDGELWGAVYRGGGPIRLNQVVVGLAMEIIAGGKKLITSAVVSIEPIEGVSSD